MRKEHEFTATGDESIIRDEKTRRFSSADASKEIASFLGTKLSKTIGSCTLDVKVTLDDTRIPGQADGTYVISKGTSRIVEGHVTGMFLSNPEDKPVKDVLLGPVFMEHDKDTFAEFKASLKRSCR